MARTRLLSPKFFLDDDLAVRSPYARLAFAGLTLLADREGRLDDRPKVIGAELFPFEDVDMNALLDELAAPRNGSSGGFIVRYQANGRKYIAIRNFLRYQKPHQRESASEIPPPTDQASATEPSPGPALGPPEVGARSGVSVSVSDPVSVPVSDPVTVSRPPARPRPPAEGEPLDAADLTAELVSEINRHLPALRLKAAPGVTTAVANLLAVGHPKGIVYANGRQPFAREDLVDATRGWIIAESKDTWHAEQRAKGSPYTFARLVQDPDRLTEYAERGRSLWASWNGGEPSAPPKCPRDHEREAIHGEAYKGTVVRMCPDQCGWMKRVPEANVDPRLRRTR